MESTCQTPNPQALFHYLLEQGMYLLYIQSLFGHRSSRTAQVYTCLTNNVLGKIVSPLDYLWRYFILAKRNT